MSMSTTIHRVTKAKVTSADYDDFSVVVINLRDEDGAKFTVSFFVQDKENFSSILEALANPNQSE
jgi:hypothetical protein